MSQVLEALHFPFAGHESKELAFDRSQKAALIQNLVLEEQVDFGTLVEQMSNSYSKLEAEGATEDMLAAAVSIKEERLAASKGLHFELVVGCSAFQEEVEIEVVEAIAVAVDTDTVAAAVAAAAVVAALGSSMEDLAVLRHLEDLMEDTDIDSVEDKGSDRTWHER